MRVRRMRLRSDSVERAPRRALRTAAIRSSGVDASEQVQQRRLAAARRSGDRDVLAVRDLDRHVAQRRDRPGRHRERARQAAAFDDRRHETVSRRSVAAIGRRVATHTGIDRRGHARRGQQREMQQPPVRGSKTKKCRRSGMPGISRRMRSSSSASTQPSGSDSSATGADQQRRFPEQRRRDAPARHAERAQRRHLAEPLVHRHGEQRRDQQEREAERDRRQHERDLAEVREPVLVEPRDDLLVRERAHIGRRAAIAATVAARVDRRPRRDQDEIGRVGRHRRARALKRLERRRQRRTRRRPRTGTRRCRRR